MLNCVIFNKPIVLMCYIGVCFEGGQSEGVRLIPYWRWILLWCVGHDLLHTQG